MFQPTELILLLVVRGIMVDILFSGNLRGHWISQEYGSIKTMVVAPPRRLEPETISIKKIALDSQAPSPPPLLVLTLPMSCLSLSSDVFQHYITSELNTQQILIESLVLNFKFPKTYIFRILFTSCKEKFFIIFYVEERKHL